MSRAPRRTAMSRVANVTLAMGLVTALIAATLFFQTSDAEAHHAEVSTETTLLCVDEELSIYYKAETWNRSADSGLHPLIHVDLRSDVTSWTKVGEGAFTDENNREFDGTTPVPEGATWVEVRVRPDENSTWGGTAGAVGGIRTLGIAVTGEYATCGTVPPTSTVPASLGDRVWTDDNRNGLQDEGEAGVGGVDVRLFVDDDGDGEPDTQIGSTTTDGDGLYGFVELDPDVVYFVQFVAPNGASLTIQNAGDALLDSDPDPISGFTGPIELYPGDDNPTVDAGVTPKTCAVGDRVWFDTDADGVQDDGEAGVAGVVVNVWIDNDGDGSPDELVAETVTNDAGIYGATVPCDEDLIVEFVNPDGTAFTLNNAGGDDTVDSDANPTTGLSPVFSLTPGETNTTLDAGLTDAAADPASLGDKVWFDTNENGIQDLGEPPVPGVEVVLWVDNNGDGVLDNAISQTGTDDAGMYGFGGLDPDLSYAVQFIPGSLGDLTNANQGGDDAVDSDADPETGFSQIVDLDPGENNPTIDAGLTEPPVEPASLGDKVWFDTTPDGIQGDGEPGVAGVNVVLWLDDDGDGTPDSVLGRTVTDDAGMYAFDNLDPALAYVVQFVPGDDLTLTGQDIGDDDGVDSDADQVTGFTAAVTLEPGENNPTIDAGVVDTPVEPASLGDKVWFDTDKDGVQDADEAGVAGVLVVLVLDDDADGTPDTELARTTTDDDGMYRFDDLDPDLTYFVQFVAPEAMELTTLNSGIDDAVDSDANPETGITGPIELDPGEHDPTIDAGLIEPTPEPASLGDKVWFDANGDGIQDADEDGVPGVTVVLWIDQDGDGIADVEIDRTTTDDDGMYGFDELDPTLTYVVIFVPGDGQSLTGQNAGDDDAVDSDADPITGATSPITLAPGENNPTIDAGIIDTPVELASLGDKVWFDTNKDGVQDPSEPGIGGVTVVLWIDDNADGAPDTELATTTTDADGVYGFDSLDPDLTYVVAFVAPDGHEPTLANVGENDLADSDADPETGLSGPIELDPGENDPSIDAGFIDDGSNLASLGDKVWLDDDRDGVQDVGEPGIAGVTVNLWADSNVDGTPDSMVATTVTDDAGMYLFDELDPGLVYIVEFVTTDTITSRDVGGNDAADSDADPITGLTSPIDLDPGEFDPTIDAGIIRLDCSLGDFVWVDRNGDGIQGDDEPGVAGVTVRVWTDDDGDGVPDDVVAETVTGAGGLYEVAVPCNEALIVEFVAPDGRSFSPADAGDNDSVDSDVDPVTGLTTPIVLEDGESDPTIDAGIIGLVAEIDIEKATNGVDADTPSDAPVVAEGELVSWTYVITNTGTTDLVNVAVADDREGAVCQLESLKIGEVATCELTGIAEASQYTNVGTTTGDPVDENGDPAVDADGSPVPSPIDQDPSGYKGVMAEVLGLEVKCATSGVTAVLTNAGDDAIVLTVLSDGNKVGDFTVPAVGSTEANVPLAEDAKTTIEVFSGDVRVGSSAIKRDCDKNGTVKEELPRTGSSSGQLAMVAMGLIAFGALMTAGSKRVQEDV